MPPITAENATLPLRSKPMEITTATKVNAADSIPMNIVDLKNSRDRDNDSLLE